MQKNLTTTIAEKVYAGLHKVVGRRSISQFIQTLMRPHVLDLGQEAAYKQMSQDEKREAEASKWSEATMRDVSNQPR